MRKLVILRPEPAASATFERALEFGLDPVKTPLFEIEPIPWSAPDPTAFDGLLVTSGNVFIAGGDQLAGLRGLPVHAVGPRTAKAARAAGFEVATVGRTGVLNLLSSIGPKLKLLHLGGEDRIDNRRARQKITVATVYRSRALELPDPGPLEGSVVLVHSPRAGAALAGLSFDKSTTRVAAISGTAAAACGSGWQDVAALDLPTDGGLLALAARLCDNETGR